MRLPLLSQTLRAIGEYGNANPHSDSGQPGNEQAQTEYILAALSYRGYWKSKGRATQTGIELDAQAFLDWVYETYQHPNMDMDTRIVLWGHSLGAAVASSAVAKRLSRSNSAEEALETASTQPPISGLILEAPISSIKDMLISLYPQKWLPYRYLWPLSWNTWDVADSLEKLGQHKNKASQSHSEFNLSANANSHHGHVPPILLMSAASDEVIPTWVADQLVDKARHHRLDIQRTDVKGAMHIEGPLKAEGKKALVEFIVNSSARSGPGPT
ncbi:Alpha/Beta hydrolase protein [Aspergillus undulatus]|uniref:Alpha/Beta hydrolase protein n=1 Tax=Aspergillus undulatus TaxID=1810928 RepID=UPI003CCCF9D9